jgi:predicted TIM-barrel fold metal-dependent hydrolase
MKIIDSQVHLWRGKTPTPIHRQIETFWADDLLAEMQQAGVDAAVLAPPSFFPEGSRVLQDVVRERPDRFALWGTFPVDDPASRELVARWRNPPFMLGARFVFVSDPERWTDGSMDWLWSAAESAKLPLGLYAYGHIDQVSRVADRHPDLPLVIEHMNVDARARGAAAFSEQDLLIGLARYANVAVKLTGLPGHSAEAYPFRDIHEPIRRVLDAFGPERCFWGTDLTRLTCSYRQAVTLFTEELPWLTGEPLRLVMGEALCRWVDWRPAPG